MKIKVIYQMYKSAKFGLVSYCHYISLIYIYIYIYFLSKTVCDPTTQQVPVATGSGLNTLEEILSITIVPVEPPPKIQEYIHQRVQVFV